MRHVLILAAACFAVAGPAMACSSLIIVRPDGARALERTPTNFELIETADLVVLGRSVASPPGTPPAMGAFGPLVPAVLAPMKALKGKLPGGVLPLSGFIAQTGPFSVPAVMPLDESNPGAMAGGCTRQTYVAGQTMLALFRASGEGLFPLAHKFARNVEDVDDESSLWVRTAKFYIDILAHPPGEPRRAALRVLRDRLLLARDADSLAIAADINRYLAIPPGTPINQEPVGAPFP